jgi:hypothetical protein
LKVERGKAPFDINGLFRAEILVGAERSDPAKPQDGSDSKVLL